MFVRSTAKTFTELQIQHVLSVVAIDCNVLVPSVSFLFKLMVFRTYGYLKTKVPVNSTAKTFTKLQIPHVLSVVAIDCNVLKSFWFKLMIFRTFYYSMKSSGQSSSMWQLSRTFTKQLISNPLSQVVNDTVIVVFLCHHCVLLLV